jgi:hypothetical protein
VALSNWICSSSVCLSVHLSFSLQQFLDTNKIFSSSTFFCAWHRGSVFLFVMHLQPSSSSKKNFLVSLACWTWTKHQTYIQAPNCSSSSTLCIVSIFSSTQSKILVANATKILTAVTVTKYKKIHSWS